MEIGRRSITVGLNVQELISLQANPGFWLREFISNYMQAIERLPDKKGLIIIDYDKEFYKRWE